MCGANEPRLTPGEVALHAVLPALLVVAATGRRLAEVAGGGYFNPDTLMRLTRLADTLHAGAPVDIVARDNSGAGFVLHWSHLIDMLLLLLAAPLRLVFPGGGAEAADAPLPAAVHWAAVAFGPLTVGALGVAVAWAALPFTLPAWRWTSAVVIGTAPPIASYGVPGMVHHHVLLAAVVAMMAGWAVRADRRDAAAGWQLGLWAGVGVWLSPEAMPFALLALGGIGVAWAQRPRADARRAALLAALLAAGPGWLLVLALGFSIDHGADGWGGASLDRISWLHIGLALAVCGIGIGAAALDRPGLRPLPRALAAAAIAAVALGAWVAAFPAVLAGPQGIVAGPVRDALFAHSLEMLPVRGAAEALRNLPGAILAAAFLLGLLLSRRSWLAAYCAVCAIAVAALAAMHVRFAIYGATLAAAVLPVLLSRLVRSPAWAGPRGVLARTACLAGFVVAPFLPAMLPAATLPVAASEGMVQDCGLRTISRLLGPFAGEIVLAEFDETADLLYRTRVRTVGSLFPRNVEGFVRQRAAWRAEPGDAPSAALRATGATLLLACPGRPRSRHVANLPPTTLRDRVDAGDPPPWLQRVAADPSGYVLYRIPAPR